MGYKAQLNNTDSNIFDKSNSDNQNASLIEAESTFLIKNRNKLEDDQSHVKQQESTPRRGERNKELSEQDDDNISVLLKEALQLQEEINDSLTDFSRLNRQVRIDIDDFCKIRNLDVSNVSKLDK